VEVEAVDAGRLARIVVPEGGGIAVKQPVAYLAANEADVDAYLARRVGDLGAPAKAEAHIPASTRVTEPTPTTSLPPGTDGGRVKASPAARKAAEQRGIDLSSLGAGSGPGGRIVSSDVPAAAAASAASPVVAANATRKKLTRMRKAIAATLQASKQNVPHFYARKTVDAEPMFALYQEEKSKYPCSLNDLITAACSRVLREMPGFRSRLEDDELVELSGANIGIAVGMEQGLSVPVLVGAEHLSLAEIAAKTRHLVEQARAGKLEGSGQGVFTITNLGMHGVEEFAAIINPPEAAILAVGALRKAAVVKDESVCAGRVLTMTLSCDHRVVDGLQAAQFLARLNEILESPEQLRQPV